LAKKDEEHRCSNNCHHAADGYFDGTQRQSGDGICEQEHNCASKGTDEKQASMRGANYQPDCMRNH
jgi:hypothetical protein